MAIKGGKVQLTSQIECRWQYGQTVRLDSNLVQLQLLLLEMERQLLIISAMIDRLRSRWGLPGGLPVIRQRRHSIGSGIGQPGQSSKERVSTAT